MKLAKKLYMIALGLCVSLPSYGLVEDNFVKANLEGRFSLEEKQEEILLMMMQQELIMPSEEGVKITDKGQSILDKLAEEGRLEVFASKGATICWP